MTQVMVKVMLGKQEIAEVPLENIHNVRADFEKRGKGQDFWIVNPKDMDNLKQHEALRKLISQEPLVEKTPEAVSVAAEPVKETPVKRSHKKKKPIPK